MGLCGFFSLFGGFFSFLIFDWGRSGFLFCLVDEADKKEDYKSDDQEVNKSLDEVSIVNSCGFNAFNVGGDSNFQGSEVEATDEHRDDWHDDVIDERGDNRGKSATDDDTDGEVDYGATVNELLELFDDFWFFFLDFSC